MNPQELIGLAVKTSISLTLFGFGLEATRDDLLYLLRRPRLLLRSLFAMFVVMPLFAVFLTTIFHFQRPVMIALLALAISPVPPVLPQKVTKAGGVAPYGLGLMVTMASFSILYIPLAVEGLDRYFHRGFAMGPGLVAKLIVLSILLPLAVGIIFKRLAPVFAAHIGRPAGILAKILLIVSMVPVLGFALPKSLSLIGDGTLWSLIAFTVVGLTAGHIFGGPGPDGQVTLALSTACRHPGLVMAMTAVNIPQEHNLTSAILLYLVLSALLTALYIFWQRRKVKNQSAQIASERPV
jgi:BASS family bile acid:Na+ symporter